MSAHKRPRLIALAAILRGDDLLVSEIHDPVEGVFYRPPGGSIEFGELGAEAAARELREELGLDIVVRGRLAVIENRFVYQGEPGHEVILLVKADLADPAGYRRDEFPRLDILPGERRAVWMPLAAFRAGDAVLYPAGLLDVLVSRRAGRDDIA